MGERVVEVEETEVEVTVRIKTVKWVCPWGWHSIPVREFRQEEPNPDQMDLFDA
jgi:hypothetical protein